MVLAVTLGRPPVRHWQTGNVAGRMAFVRAEFDPQEVLRCFTILGIQPRHPKQRGVLDRAMLKNLPIGAVG